MALPIQNSPIYTLRVPSIDKDIKYRPFLVKDMKILLIAGQSEDPIVMLDTLKQTISSCTHGSVNVDTLPPYEIDYIFAQIRSKSIGELCELMFTCGSCDQKNNVVKISVDISAIEITTNEKHTKKIHLFDDVGVVMKYPSTKILNTLDEDGLNDPNKAIDIVIECIDYIFTDKEIFHTKEQTKEELYTFIENLKPEQLENIKEFFTTMPKFQKLIEFNCPACGVKNKSLLEGIQSFF